MGNRRWVSNEEGKNICARGRIQERDYTIVPQHPSRRTWRKIEDVRVGC